MYYKCIVNIKEERKQTPSYMACGNTWVRASGKLANQAGRGFMLGAVIKSAMV